MAEYIERETFLKDIEERYCLPCKEAGRDHNGCKCDVCWVDDMRGDVIDVPDVDVAPVVHGRWKCHGDCGVTECSVCGWSIEEYAGDYAYCPECGARMDGGSENG